MNNVIRHLRALVIGTTLLVTWEAYGQPADLVLQDTTITTVAMFTATNSITAGPNFTIAGSGDVTFVTAGTIYLRPGIVIVQGGSFRAIGDSTLLDVRLPESGIPVEFALRQNYPNPFNPTTTIRFSIPKSVFVSLKVYTLLGQEVATVVNESLPAGPLRTGIRGRQTGQRCVSVPAGCRAVFGDEADAAAEVDDSSYTLSHELILHKYH